MKKSDIAELKKHLKKENTCINYLAGCCVNTDNAIETSFSERLLSYEDGEVHKFLETANKVLSGKLKNNLLEAEFPNDSSVKTGLSAITNSDLQSPEMLESLYHQIIDANLVEPPYAILLFHGTYDVIDKGTDKASQDESSETYRHIICAICPIKLSKPGLEYTEDKKLIERVRDWVLDKPVNGFLYPAFTERSADINSILYYVKDTKEQNNFAETVLGITPVQTSDAKTTAFSDDLNSVLLGAGLPEHTVYDVTETLRQMIDEEVTVVNENGESDGTKIVTNDLIMSPNILSKACAECNIEDNLKDMLQNAYNDHIHGDTTVDQLIDRKFLKEQKSSQRERELLLEIAELKDEIKQLKSKIHTN